MLLLYCAITALLAMIVYSIDFIIWLGNKLESSKAQPPYLEKRESYRPSWKASTIFIVLLYIVSLFWIYLLQSGFVL